MSVADSAREAAVSLEGSGETVMGAAWVAKTALSLLLVVAIIVACAWLLRRLTPGRLRASQHLRVVASTAIGQRERVTIVEVEGRWLVLGVGGGNVSLLKDMPAAENDAAASQPTTAPLTGSFAQRFRQALAHNLGGRPSDTSDAGSRRSRSGDAEAPDKEADR